MRTSIQTALVLAGLAGFTAAARADVFVVDGVVAPGHHATIQAAIDAAETGDTILVDFTWDTSLEVVVIDGKGLNLFVDTQDEFALIRKLVIRNVPAGQRAAVAGFAVKNPANIALECTDNAGQVALYDLAAQGKQGQPQGPTQIARDGETGGIFTNCADVVMRDCGVGGGDGGDIFAAGILATSNGGKAAIITNSRLACFFTLFLGGEGGSVLPEFHSGLPGTGGTGIVSVNSTLFMFGEVGRGGSGGDAQQAPGGAGGTTVVQSGAEAALLTCLAQFSGGNGGESANFFEDGPDGAAQVILGGTTAEIGSPPAFARELWTTTPVREGEPVSITSTGFNDNIWIFLSLGTGHQLLPAYEGLLTLGAPFLSELLFLGHVPFLAKTFPLGPAPQLPAGLDVLEIHVQGVVNVGGAGFTLAAPDHIVLLDDAF